MYGLFELLASVLHTKHTPFDSNSGLVACEIRLPSSLHVAGTCRGVVRQPPGPAWGAQESAQQLLSPSMLEEFHGFWAPTCYEPAHRHPNF